MNIRFGLTATLFVALLCVPRSSAARQVPPNGPPRTAAAAEGQVSLDEQNKRKEWSDSMLRKAAPKKGCFNAAYPSTEWKEVPCVKAPNIPAGPRHGPRPAVVGNSNDVSAQAPSGHITQTIGHFENVTNVTGETGRIDRKSVV